jgi:hypothetical protein
MRARVSNDTLPMGPPNLEILNLTFTDVSDVSALVHLSKLRRLFVSSEDIDTAPLERLGVGIMIVYSE